MTDQREEDQREDRSARADEVRVEAMEPIFVLGRQHSGNTMLTTLLGRLPGMIAMTSEGDFFERRRSLDRLSPEERARRTARSIRDDGARKLISSSAFAEEHKAFWRATTRAMISAAERGASATELYVVGMQHVLGVFGETRWAQKGTSYIFVADDILRTFPRARLLFIARNPLDLAASTKRRNETNRHTLRTALGWRRGVQRAIALSESDPERFKVVRYEDLVRDSASVVQAICSFCALPYDAACLDIPHVNRSESPYTTESKQSGLNASRVYYYDSILTGEEQAAVRGVVGAGALSRLYPELAGDHAGSLSVEALGVLAAGALAIVGEEARRVAQAPIDMLSRIRNRL